MANGTTVKTALMSGGAGSVIGAMTMFFYLLTKAMIPVGTLGSLTPEESVTMREVAAGLVAALAAGGARMAYLWLRGHFDLEPPVAATALLALMVGLGTLPFLGGCATRLDYKSPMATVVWGDSYSIVCEGTTMTTPEGNTTCNGKLIEVRGGNMSSNLTQSLAQFWTAVSSALKFLTPAGLVP